MKLQNAIDLIDKGVSVREAARSEGLNFSLVQRKNALRNINSPSKTTSRTLLTEDQENYLEDHIINCALRGFPKTLKDIKRDAMQILKAFPSASAHINQSKDGTPGRHWIEGFLKRHPKLSSRKCEAISKANSKVCSENLESWHTYIFDYLKSMNLEHVLKDPSIIANSDESGIPLSEKDSKRVGLKSLKTRYNIQLGNNKENLSVLFTGLADGTLLKPFVVFKGERLSPQLISQIPDTIDYAITKSGWMEHDAFLEFIKESFVPQMKKLKRNPPYLLFIDGHRSHVSIEISSVCEGLGVILITLYPNATHIIQPLDVSLFRPFKIKWQDQLHACKVENPYFNMTKFNFANIFSQFLERNDFSESIRNGFRKCGLYPYNFNSIDLSRIVALPSSNLSEINKTHFVFGPEPAYYDKPIQSILNSSTDSCLETIANTRGNVSSPVESLVNVLSRTPLSAPGPSFEIYDESLDPLITQSVSSNACNVEMFSDNAQSNPWSSLNHIFDNTTVHNSQANSIVNEDRIDNYVELTYENTDSGYSTHHDDVTKHPNFEQAARDYAFATVQKVVGPHLNKLLSNHQFQEYSANDYALKKIYLTFKPPETCEDILISPPPVFGTVNQTPNMDRVIVSSQKARDSLISPTPAQLKKAEEMQMRMKRRELMRKEKENRAQEEKLRKVTERKKLKEMKENEKKAQQATKKRKANMTGTNKKLKILQDTQTNVNSNQNLL